MSVAKFPQAVIVTSLAHTLFGSGILVLLRYLFAYPTTMFAHKDTHKQLGPDFRDSGYSSNNRPEFTKHFTLKVSNACPQMISGDSFIKGNLILLNCMIILLIFECMLKITRRIAVFLHLVHENSESPINEGFIAGILVKNGISEIFTVSIKIP